MSDSDDVQLAADWLGKAERLLESAKNNEEEAKVRIDLSISWRIKADQYKSNAKDILNSLDFLKTDPLEN